MKSLHIIFCIIFYFAQNYCFSQPVRILEKEILLQGSFIDGAMMQNLAQYEKAEKIYVGILEKDAKNAAAHYELARVYGALKQHEKAMQFAKSATEFDKTNTWYKLLFADILSGFGKYKEAAVLYEALTKIDPRNEYYYYEWAECLGLAGNKEKAIKAFEALEKKIGVDEDICRQKHVLFLELNELKKAEKELEKLVYNFPENIDFYHLLAGYYKQIGDKEKEIATYKRVLAIFPADGKANIALAATIKTDSKDAEYMKVLATIFANKEISLDVKIKELIPYANKVANTNEAVTADAAIDLVKILEKNHPEEAKVNAIYGDFLFYTNRKAAALAKYQKTVQLNASVFSVWEQIFLIQTENKDFTGLLKSADAALEIFPNQAIVFYYHGVANANLKKTEEAIASFEQANLMAGKNMRLKLDVIKNLGKILYASGQYEKAKTQLNKGIAIGGENDVVFLEQLGDAFFQTKDVDSAVLFWQKAKVKGSKSIFLDKKIVDRKIYE